jgi:pimeloyl-ACP methyl ester carboxylesterase
LKGYRVFIRRWLSRILYAFLAVICVVLLMGFTYEQLGRMHDARRFPPRVGQPVDIGGRTINLYCSGEASPTVILEAGGNGPGYGWSPVQSKIAAFTRACWYDRAGVGWSDPPSRPRTAASVVDDLHEALNRAAIAPPYVFVGASIGAEYARVYTNRYPHDVAGLVFVDSAHPDQREPAFMRSQFNLMSPGKRHVICTILPFMARFGMLRFIAARMNGPVSPQFTPEQAHILAKLTARPEAARADAEQTCAATDQGRFVPDSGTGNPDLDRASRNAGDLGDRPLIVLTAGKYWAPPGFEKEAAEFHEIWISQLQASLAHLSTRGRQVIESANHDMEEVPDAVNTATQEVVKEVRAKTE